MSLSSPRSSQVASRLEALARRLGPGEKLPRLSDLCRDLGASARTLDAALGQLEAQGLVERRHAVGVFCTQAVRERRRSLRLAVVCSPECFHSAGHSPLWDQLLGLLRERAARDGVEFDCFFTRSRNASHEAFLSDELAGALQRGEFDGVLGLELPQSVAEEIMAHHVPLVSLFGKGNAVIGVDSSLQVRLGVGELVAHGARKLMLWQRITPHAPMTSLGMQSLLSVPFAEAVRSYEAQSQGTLSVADSMDVLNAPVEHPTQQGLRLAREVFGRERAFWPDGLLVADDLLARGALLGLQQMGVRVGRDVHVAVHANRHSPVLWGEAGLILVEVDPAELVEAMWSHLDRLLESGALAEETQQLVAPHLVASTLVLRLEAPTAMFSSAPALST